MASMRCRLFLNTVALVLRETIVKVHCSCASCGKGVKEGTLLGAVIKGKEKKWTKKTSKARTKRENRVVLPPAGEEKKNQKSQQERLPLELKKNATALFIVERRRPQLAQRKSKSIEDVATLCQ
jgi:hypothetical protein